MGTLDSGIISNKRELSSKFEVENLKGNKTETREIVFRYYMIPKIKRFIEVETYYPFLTRKYLRGDLILRKQDFSDQELTVMRTKISYPTKFSLRNPSTWFKRVEKNI